MFILILSTKRPTLKELRIARIKKIKKAPEWPLVSAFMVNEMKPVIEFIIKSKSESIVVEVCKKYLIIACVSLMEEFLIRLARRTIDDKKIDISVFGNEISKSFSCSKETRKGTVGEFVATYDYLGNLENADKLFSRILKSDSRFASLNINFLDAVKQFDSHDPYREFKGLRTRHLYKNWNEFMKMFQIRNEIIHGIPKIHFSNTRVFCFCDNILNFLEAAIAICIMDDNILYVLKSKRQVNRQGLITV